MKYHLWDSEAGSYIGQYTEESAALATVQSLVDRYGTTFADELSLGREQDDGTILPPLTGSELVARLAPSDERNGRVIGSGKHTTAGAGIAAATARRPSQDRE
jgi:hypothetical protein